MWLIPIALGALLITGLGRFVNWRYGLKSLSLMFWGGTLMILVDHIMGYEGGPFLEAKTHGLITNGLLLGVIMTGPVVIAWLIIILVARLRRHG